MLDFSVLGIKKGSSVQIWGVGNPLLGDDAVGGVVALRLGGIDCGTTPENYISKLRKNPPDFLLIIDAADFGETPGTIKILELDEISGTIFTSHGVPLKTLLEPFTEKTKIYLIGIQPKNLGLGEVISAEVEGAMEIILSHHEKFSPR